MEATKSSILMANLIGQGFKIVPIGLGSKIPASKGWQQQVLPALGTDEFVSATSTGNNVMILQDFLVDVDIDTPMVLKLAPNFLPNTPFVWGRKSNPGSHWLYRSESDAKKVVFNPLVLEKGQEVHPLVELRAGSGCASLAPGSQHPTGEEYWFEQEDVNPAAVMPAEAQYSDLYIRTTLMALCGGLVETWAACGTRDQLAYTIAGILCRHGFPQELSKLTIEWAAKLARDEEELQKGARSRKVAEVWATAAQDGATQKLPGYKALGDICGEDVKAWVRKTLRGAAPVGSTEAPDLNTVADFFADEYGDNLVFVRQTETWYRWLGTHWETISTRTGNQGSLENLANKAVQSVGMKLTRAGLLDEVIRVSSGILEKPMFMEQKGLLNLPGGTWDIETKTMHAHTPEDGQRSVLPYMPAPGPCPKIDAFLAQSIPDPQSIHALEEHTGLALLGDHELQRGLVLLGSGGSGKSTIGHLASMVCGEDPDMQPTADLFSDGAAGRLSRINWNHLRLCHISEFPADAFQHGAEILKAMLSHNTVAMRHHYKEEARQNRWLPKVLLTANESPRFLDQGGAIERRLLVVTCPNSVPLHKMDRRLRRKLAAEIPQWAYRCLQRALVVQERNSGYTESPTMVAARRKLMQKGDPIQGFAAEYLCADLEGVIQKTDLYDKFKAYLDLVGKSRIQQSRLLDGLQGVFPQSREKKVRIGGGQHWCIVGIRLRKDSDDEQGPQDSGPETPNVPNTGPMFQEKSDLEHSWNTSAEPVYSGGDPQDLGFVPMFQLFLEIPLSEGKEGGNIIESIAPKIGTLEQIPASGLMPALTSPVLEAENMFQECSKSENPWNIDPVIGTKPPKKAARAKKLIPLKGDLVILPGQIPIPFDLPEAPIIKDGPAYTIPQWVKEATLLGLDTETAKARGTTYGKENLTALDPHQGRLRLLTLSDGENVEVIDTWQYLEATMALESILLDPARTIIAHNATFDMKWLLDENIDLGQNWADTMLMSKVLDGGLHHEAGYHKLATLAQRLLAVTLDKSEQKSDWSLPLTAEQLTYAGLDAKVLVPLYMAMEPLLRADGLWPTITLEHRTLPAVALMEYNGINITPSIWKGLADTAVEKVAELGPKLRELLGPINVASPLQLKKALAALGIVVESTDKEHLNDVLTLNKLSATPEDPAVQKRITALETLAEYKDHLKNSTTYSHAWLAKQVNPVTGRVHAHFNQIVDTGRFSCADPNLQNLPRGEYRKAFTARAGYALIKVDYTAIEMRIAAALSQDRSLLDAFNSSQDIHSRTAALLLNKDISEVTKADRQVAKSANFGLLYGSGVDTLRSYAATAFKVVMTSAEAAKHRATWFRAYPGIKQWQTRETSYLVSGTGNIGEDDMWVSDNTPKDTRDMIGRLRRQVPNFTQKLNTPCQSTGASGIKAAMGNLYQDRAAFPHARLVCTVHDELCYECPIAEAPQVAAWVERHMVDAMTEVTQHKVLIEAEATICKDWSGAPLDSPIT